MTTLPELERLIRRIEDALDHPTASDGLQKLAADYHAVSRAAATRLAQCASMIAAGDEHQAIQLAETQPALLDILTLLSFRRSPNWRALCRGENLPATDAFDLKALRQLNDTYAKGIDQDHALYRDYRRAVMLNDDAQALAILRSIARLNPNDKNARAELERLEHKYWHEKARKLETLVKKHGDEEEIARLVDELESARALPNNDATARAREIRAHVLLKRARESRKSAGLRETQQLVEKLNTARNFLDENERAELDEFDRWIKSESQRRAEEAGRQSAFERLGAVAHRLEQDELTPRKRSLQELRAAADSLERAWRQVEQFRAAIPADLSTRVQRVRDRLRSEIDRSLRASRQIAFASVAAVVLLCLGAAWFAYSRHASRSLAVRLNAMIAERRVTEAEAALAASSNYTASPALLETQTKASQFVEREKSLNAAADSELTRLEHTVQPEFVNSQAEAIVQGIESAHKKIETLAPEFRSIAGKRLNKIESDWNRYLSAARAQASAKLDALIAPIESAATNQLQHTQPPERVLESAQRLNQSLSPARAIASAPVVRPNQEALFRLQNLEARVEKFSRDATNFLSAHDRLASATNFAAYNDALQLVVSSGFAPDRDRAAASVIAGLNLSFETLLAPLLLSNAPQTALLASAPATLFPETVLPAEKEIQRRLRDDQNIHGVSRLEIEVKSLPTDDPHRRRVVYLRGELQRHITRRAGQIYDPVESPNALNFAQKELGSLEFSVDEPTSTPERDLYERCGLPRLLDANTGRYQLSLLQILDDINQDHRANPLFRAYLTMRLYEMIDAQPVAWGAIWSPALARDRAELARLSAGQIRSGDWMIPAKIAARAAALTAHFDRAALHSYTREAAFFRRLLPKAMQTGLRLIGYISSNGEPILREPAPAGPIWGLTSPTARVEIVLPPKSQNPALPFSPLFIFAGDANALADEIVQSLGYSPAAVGVPESLPPILRAAPTQSP
jgi:hypothetical protein